MNIFKQKAVYLFIMLTFSAGCASVQVIIPPTPEELMAVKQGRKSVAVFSFSEEDSPIQGVQTLVLASIEKILSCNLNVIEPKNIENILGNLDYHLSQHLDPTDQGTIKSILAEPDFNFYDDGERIFKIGRLLGADYLIFGVVNVSVPGLEIKNSQGKDADGNFKGRVWEDICAQAKVSIKIVDVNSGTVIYSGKKGGKQCKTIRDDNYKEEAIFWKEVRSREAAEKYTKVSVAGNLSNLNKEHYNMVVGILNSAVNGFSYNLKNKFSQSGEVLKILSKKEVLVNLGSAHGIRPGQRFAVWSQDEPIVDPNTGMEIYPREKKGILKVYQVTSGLSCIAIGRPKLIMKIQRGDKIYIE